MVARLKLRFATLFLAAFALLLVVWSLAGVGDLYRKAVFSVVRVAAPVLTGWWFEPRPPAPYEFPVFERGTETVQLVLNPAVLSLAHIPLLSLLIATPGLTWHALVLRGLLGVAAVFVLHVGVVVAYPVLLEKPDVFKDSVGVFLGLLSFVLAPQLLWFVLTYPELRALWRLDATTEGSERPAPRKRKR